MTKAKVTSSNYLRYLLVLFIVSTVIGIILLHYNRSIYNAWFLGMEHDQFSVWTVPKITTAELVEYWNWKPGRMMLVFCLSSWAVAFGSGLWLMFINLKNSLAGQPAQR